MRHAMTAAVAAFVFGVVAAPAVEAGTITGKVPCGRKCANYVVYVKKVPGSFSGAGEVADFDQQNRVFLPHVLPILKGTTVRLKNSDPFLHNVHAYKGKETFFNVALPFIGQTLDQEFADPGNYLILCDAHSEMSAFIVVLDNPYFASADENGAFEIADVPAGSYTLVSLDAENDKGAEKQVTVGDGAAQVDF